MKEVNDRATLSHQHPILRYVSREPNGAAASYRSFPTALFAEWLCGVGAAVRPVAFFLAIETPSAHEK
jgi:hypothetical protein